MKLLYLVRQVCGASIGGRRRVLIEVKKDAAAPVTSEVEISRFNE